MCVKFVLNLDNKRYYEIKVSLCKEKNIHRKSNFNCIWLHDAKVYVVPLKMLDSYKGILSAE